MFTLFKAFVVFSLGCLAYFGLICLLISHRYLIGPVVIGAPLTYLYIRAMYRRYKSEGWRCRDE